MKTIALRDDIQWVGKVDDRDVPFHRLTLSKGTTYNSYLIQSEKATIIDTVDFSFAKEYVEALSSKIDLGTIQYIVINHTEPDHSGGLGALAARAKEATIVCSEKAVYELKEMYKLHKREFLVVKDGDQLDIGGKTLVFYETPYLHTEETMVTYVKEDGILFSCDIFSTHIANESYFDDRATNDFIEDFKVYYSLIMHPHKFYVQDMIAKIRPLDIQMIAPSHGYILRDQVGRYIDIYDEMSRDKVKAQKGVVIYTSLTRNTKKISEAMKAIYEQHGMELELLDVNQHSVETIKEAVEKAAIVFVGTSTKYADMVGKLEEVLKAVVAMNLEGKIGVAFGSYGWSGEAIEIVQDYLEGSNITTLKTSDVIKATGMTDVQYPIRIRFSLNEDNRHNFERAIIHTIELVTGL